MLFCRTQAIQSRHSHYVTASPHDCKLPKVERAARAEIKRRHRQQDYLGEDEEHRQFVAQLRVSCLAPAQAHAPPYIGVCLHTCACPYPALVHIPARHVITRPLLWWEAPRCLFVRFSYGAASADQALGLELHDVKGDGNCLFR